MSVFYTNTAGSFHELRNDTSGTLPNPGLASGCFFVRLKADQNNFCPFIHMLADDVLNFGTAIMGNATGTTVQIFGDDVAEATGPNLVINRWFFIAFRTINTLYEIGYDFAESVGNSMRWASGSGADLAVDGIAINLLLASYFLDNDFMCTADLIGFRCWSRVLTRYELTFEASSIRSRNRAKLTCEYPFYSNIIGRDTSGYQHHLTPGGGPIAFASNFNIPETLIQTDSVFGGAGSIDPLFFGHNF